MKEALRNMAAASAGRDDEAQELMRYAQAALQSREPVFQMRVFVLLRDPDLAHLLDRARQIEQAFSGTLAFAGLTGQQLAALAYFGDHPDPAMPSPVAHHVVLGSALPLAAGGLAGMVSRAEVGGIQIGLRLETGMPIYVREWQGQQAGHIGILGKTGFGKSVMVGKLLRDFHGLYDAAIVHIDPIGVSQKAYELFRAQGVDYARFHRLDWASTQINPLDWVGANLEEQQDHVIGILRRCSRAGDESARQHRRRAAREGD
jgi:hypothetical protein